MLGLPDHYFSAFFVLGLVVVAAYAWQRFNDPSFPNEEALPRTLAPLRYLFLKGAYQKALLTYVAISLLLYSLLVLPGPTIIPALSAVGVDDFPPDGWALLVALILVGLVPNSNLRWLTAIEEWMRRLVHAWFLVPHGIVKTIGILEDARYEPPASQLDALPNPLKEKLRNDLKLPTNSLRYRWARATMLISSLLQMGAGANYPLRKAAFDPFQEDFQAIVDRRHALAPEIEAIGDGAGDGQINDEEANLIRQVDKLLKQVYAYISWGIRHQADREEEVDQTLEELGFGVPPTGVRRLFNVVCPAILLVAVITMVFWLIIDAIHRTIGVPAPSLHESVVLAVSTAVATSVMYGFAISIAIKRRSAQIEQKVWQQGVPSCLVPIAVHAGMVTWAAIVASTVLWQLPATLDSLGDLAQVVRSLATGDATSGPDTQQWSFLPIRIATALPWFLAGATVSVLLAALLGGDVRRRGRQERVRDTIAMGFGLAFAVATAQLIQISFADLLLGQSASLDLVPIVGLAGFACGAVIGFVVPKACRDNLSAPPDPIMARALRDLSDQAEVTLGTRQAADDWIFQPRAELGGITPAEAVQYQAYANGVRRLLKQVAPRDVRAERGDRLRAVV